MIALALAILSSGTGGRPVAVTIARRTIVRVRGVATPPPPAYREKHGPRCIVAADVAGAAVTGPQSIDFGLRGGRRVRARLEQECPALDFYGGFYVTPQPDGRICADRDAIRTRSGGECGIDRFRALVPLPAPETGEKPARP